MSALAMVFVFIRFLFRHAIRVQSVTVRLIDDSALSYGTAPVVGPALVATF